MIVLVDIPPIICGSLRPVVVDINKVDTHARIGLEFLKKGMNDISVLLQSIVCDIY